MKHVAGPWEVTLVTGDTCAVGTTEYPKRVIAVFADDVAGHRNPENARLAAQAPTMLEELQWILQQAEEYERPDGSLCLQALLYPSDIKRILALVKAVGGAE